VGIAFLTVVTATITSAFVEGSRERMGRGRDQALFEELRAIRERLEALEPPGGEGNEERRTP
jgi:hypothetical protein